MQIVWTLITIGIGIMINLFLFRFANHSKLGVDRLDQTSLESGINGLGSYFKFSVIGMCITLVAAVAMGIYSQLNAGI